MPDLSQLIASRNVPKSVGNVEKYLSSTDSFTEVYTEYSLRFQASIAILRV